MYVGESSRSVYTRANGHYTDLKSKIKTGKRTSWMADHIQEVHGGMHNENEPWRLVIVPEWIIQESPK